MTPLVPERSSISHENATVLVVEPDAGLRADLIGWLRTAGYATREADSFEDARRRLAGDPPAVLVAGLRLGAFNGLHLIITARAAWPRIRAVLTASAQDGSVADEARQIDVACVTRPINREALLAAVAHGRGGAPDDMHSHLSRS